MNCLKHQGADEGKQKNHNGKLYDEGAEYLEAKALIHCQIPHWLRCASASLQVADWGGPNWARDLNNHKFNPAQQFKARWPSNWREVSIPARKSYAQNFHSVRLNGALARAHLSP